MEIWYKVKIEARLFAENKLQQTLTRMAPIDLAFYRNSMHVKYRSCGKSDTGYFT
jgi:hypothetical protein